MQLLVASQIAVILVGLVWLGVLAARPGIIVKGSGWATGKGLERWKNPWLWAMVAASTLDLLGRLPLGEVSGQIPIAANCLWLSLVGRDLGERLISEKAGRHGYKYLAARLQETQIIGRTGVFGCAIVAILLFIHVASLLQHSGAFDFSQTASELSYWFKLLLVVRVSAEFMLLDSRIRDESASLAPGSLVGLTVAFICFIWVVVSVLSASKDFTLAFGALFVIALGVVTVAWGSEGD